MLDFFIAILLLFLGGLIAACSSRSDIGHQAGQIGAIVGSVFGLVSALRVLIGGAPVGALGVWHMPGGTLHFEIDAVSAFFLLPVFGLSIVTAFYGRSYLSAGDGEHDSAASWFYLNLLTASMALVIAARDGLLFLLAWEIMALSPFFLVIFDDRKAAARHAAWTYLAATHLGTAFLLVMFVVLGGLAGTSDFGGYGAVLHGHPTLSSAIFVLALIGFGAKAGIVPAHVWLPEAHPAAPSHASALMSGSMIKVGIYGIVRILMMLGTPEAWWGWALIAIGATSGVLGVLFALAQHDLKRLLAYHSVENIGIILLGIGVGVLGLATGLPALAVIGFAAGLIHVVNHCIFKGLLFLGAGAVQHAAHTLDLEELGGLLKHMKWTGTAFLIGSAAIVGLPPLNGFVSEFLLFTSGFVAVTHRLAVIATAGLIVIVVMGLISGLAAACFAKAFGIVFLGEPRSAEAAHAHEAVAAMRWPMIVLAGLCILIGLSAPLWPLILQPAVAVVMPEQSPLSQRASGVGVEPLMGVMFGSYILLGLIVLVLCVRRRLLVGRRVEQSVTWGCGYPAPTPRMQYTASSFARPLVLLFRLFLQPHDVICPPRGLFPQRADLHTHAPDLFRRRLYEPLFVGVARMASRLRWLQEGRIQIYTLYIALTILALLIWKLG